MRPAPLARRRSAVRRMPLRAFAPSAHAGPSKPPAGLSKSPTDLRMSDLILALLGLTLLGAASLMAAFALAGRVLAP